MRAFQLGYALAGLPRSVLSPLWWVFRKPRRVAGLLASLFVAYYPLVVIGFVDYMAAMRTAAVTAATAVRDTVVDSSEAVALWYEWAQEWRVVLLKIMPLRKWLGLIVAFALAACGGLSELLMEETPPVVSSSVDSEAEKPVARAGESPAPEGKPSEAMFVLEQKLADLAASQKAIAEEMSEWRIARGPRELRRRTMEDEDETSKDRVQILSVMSRLDEFSKQLGGTSREAEQKAPRPASSDATAGTGSYSTPTKDPVAGRLFADSSPESGDKRPVGESSEAVKLAIKRMRDQPPQRIFLERLEKFREIRTEE